MPNTSRAFATRCPKNEISACTGGTHMTVVDTETFRFLNVRPVQAIEPGKAERRFARYGGRRSPLQAEIEALVEAPTATSRSARGAPSGADLRVAVAGLARRRIAAAVNEEAMAKLERVVDAAAARAAALAVASMTRNDL